MADNVQYILDRMAPTFQLLEALELFSMTEVKSIVKRRTEYEYMMKRRQLACKDVYGYIQYELNLDKLRHIREEMIADSDRKKNRKNDIDDNNDSSSSSLRIHGKDRKNSLRNISTAFIRHICYVFERSIRRFSTEMDLWVDYISFLKEKESNSILNTVYGRAIALHPNNEMLWISAALHELNVNNNSHAARVLFQRSIRSNKRNKSLWIHYFELELRDAVRITARQDVLGLEANTTAVVHGVPSIVYKNAIKAIPDIAFACELHQKCMSVSTELSNELQLQLQAAFHDSPALYEYLVGSLQYDAKPITATIDTCSSDSKGSKKKRKAAVSSYTNDLIVSSVEYLKKTNSLIVEGVEAMKASDSVDAIGSESMQLMVVRCNAKVISTLSTVLSNVDTNDEHASYDDLIQTIKANIEYMDKQCGISTNHHVSATAFSTLHIYVTTVKHQLYMLATALNIKLPASITTNCSEVASILACYTKLLSHTDQLNIEVWCAAGRSALDAAVRRSYVITTSDDTGSTSDDIHTVIKACMTSNSTTVLCSCDSGRDFIASIIDALAVGNSHETITSILETVIKSRHCQATYRSIYCCMYIQYMLSIKRSNESALDTIQAAHEYIRKALNSSPVLLIDSDIDVFYTFIMDIVISVVKKDIVTFKNGHDASSIKKMKSYNVAKSIIDVAMRTVSEDNNDKLIDTKEYLERIVGNHKLANHYRHKKNSQL